MKQRERISCAKVFEKLSESESGTAMVRAVLKTVFYPPKYICSRLELSGPGI